jgi:hypothetical protein
MPTSDFIYIHHDTLIYGAVYALNILAEILTYCRSQRAAGIISPFELMIAIGLETIGPHARTDIQVLCVAALRLARTALTRLQPERFKLTVYILPLVPDTLGTPGGGYWLVRLASL